jgi:hypothetical protein
MVPIPAEADEDGRRRGPGAIVFDGRHQRFGGRLDGALGFDARKARYLSGRRPTRVNSICSKRASSVLFAFLTTKAVVPGMVSRGYGRLIYLIAGLSRRPRDGMITRTTLRRPWTNSCGMSPWSWRPHGFTANLVAPATVQGSRSTEQFTAERMHELTTATPMGRLVRSDDVAKRRRCLIKS